MREDYDECCHVHLARQIQPDPAGFPDKGLDRQVRIRARIPGAHVHPGHIRIDPFIEVLGLKVVHRARQLHGLGLQRHEHFFSNGNTPVRIRLDQSLPARPVISVI